MTDQTDEQLFDTLPPADRMTIATFRQTINSADMAARCELTGPLTARGQLRLVKLFGQFPHHEIVMREFGFNTEAGEELARRHLNTFEDAES